MSSRGAKKVKVGAEKESRRGMSKNFSTLSLTFGTPGLEGPGNASSTPFSALGPKGPRTPLPDWGDSRIARLRSKTQRCQLRLAISSCDFILSSALGSEI